MLFATSGTVAAASYYTLGDVVGHADPSTMQTLNLLQGDFSDGMGEAGVALFLLASSIAIIRGDGRIPQWVAWLGIVLGIASVVIFGIGLPALGLWLLVTCITLLIRVPSSSPTTQQQPALT